MIDGEKRILIIDNGSSHTGKIIDICKNRFSKVDVIKSFDYKYDIQNYDLSILTGGPAMPDDSCLKEFSEEVKLIMNSEKPVVGICFGFQLIAKAYNSELVEKEQRIVGEFPIRILLKDNIFDGIKEQAIFHETHLWVVNKVGDKLFALANSYTGFEAVRHKTKPIYGFQFHPEVNIGNGLGDRLFENIFKLISYNN